MKGKLDFYFETGTEGGHWAFLEDGKNGYNALHLLEDGNELTIFDKEVPDKVIWTGKIDLERFPVFTEAACGLWIHAEQKGIDRETWAAWFFQNHPAELKDKTHGS